jgi:hypothetical protein
MNTQYQQSQSPENGLTLFYIKDFELSLTESANAHGLFYRQHIMGKESPSSPDADQI